MKLKNRKFVKPNRFRFLITIENHLCEILDQVQNDVSSDFLFCICNILYDEKEENTLYSSSLSFSLRSNSA